MRALHASRAPPQINAESSVPEHWFFTATHAVLVNNIEKAWIKFRPCKVELLRSRYRQQRMALKDRAFHLDQTADELLRTELSFTAEMHDWETTTPCPTPGESMYLELNQFQSLYGEDFDDEGPEYGEYGSPPRPNSPDYGGGSFLANPSHRAGPSYLDYRPNSQVPVAVPRLEDFDPVRPSPFPGLPEGSYLNPQDGVGAVPLVLPGVPYGPAPVGGTHRPDRDDASEGSLHDGLLSSRDVLESARAIRDLVARRAAGRRKIMAEAHRIRKTYFDPMDPRAGVDAEGDEPSSSRREGLSTSRSSEFAREEL